MIEWCDKNSIVDLLFLLCIVFLYCKLKKINYSQDIHIHRAGRALVCSARKKSTKSCRKFDRFYLELQCVCTFLPFASLNCIIINTIICLYHLRLICLGIVQLCMNACCKAITSIALYCLLFTWL